MPIAEFAQEKKKRRPTDGVFEFFALVEPNGIEPSTS